MEKDILEKWGSIFNDSYKGSILPIAMKIAAKTISQDLIFASDEEIDSVKNKLKEENRIAKIDSVIEDKEFVEKKLEEDPEYIELSKKGVTPMSAPSGDLFYLDFNSGNDDVSELIKNLGMK